MIGRTCLQFAAQSPVGLAQIVIRYAREEMVQRMIAQANRSPQRRQHAWWRNVDAVEELGRDAHRLALILPQVRDERAYLVEEHHA